MSTTRVSELGSAIVAQLLPATHGLVWSLAALGKLIDPSPALGHLHDIGLSVPTANLTVRALVAIDVFIALAVSTYPLSALALKTAFLSAFIIGTLGAVIQTAGGGAGVTCGCGPDVALGLALPWWATSATLMGLAAFQYILMRRRRAIAAELGTPLHCAARDQ